MYLFMQTMQLNPSHIAVLESSVVKKFDEELAHLNLIFIIYLMNLVCLAEVEKAPGTEMLKKKLQNGLEKIILSKQC